MPSQQLQKVGLTLLLKKLIQATLSVYGEVTAFLHPHTHRCSYSLTHPLAHSLTQTLTRPLTLSLTHSLNRQPINQCKLQSGLISQSPTRPLPPSLTHPLTHSRARSFIHNKLAFLHGSTHLSTSLGSPCPRAKTHIETYSRGPFHGAQGMAPSSKLHYQGVLVATLSVTPWWQRQI